MSLELAEFPELLASSTFQRFWSHCLSRCWREDWTGDWHEQFTYKRSLPPASLGSSYAKLFTSPHESSYEKLFTWETEGQANQSWTIGRLQCTHYKQNNRVSLGPCSCQSNNERSRSSEFICSQCHEDHCQCKDKLRNTCCWRIACSGMLSRSRLTGRTTTRQLEQCIFIFIFIGYVISYKFTVIHQWIKYVYVY